MTTSTTQAAGSSGGLSSFLAKRWFSLLLTAVAVVFIAQNRDDVTIRFFGMSVTGPMWIVLAALFAAGLVAGLVRGRRKKPSR